MACQRIHEIITNEEIYQGQTRVLPITLEEEHMRGREADAN